MTRTKPSPTVADMRRKLKEKLDLLEDLVPLLNGHSIREAILAQIQKLKEQLPKLNSKQRMREARIKFKMLVYFADSAFLD
jgi:hypothetical protein